MSAEKGTNIFMFFAVVALIGSVCPILAGSLIVFNGALVTAYRVRGLLLLLVGVLVCFANIYAIFTTNGFSRRDMALYPSIAVGLAVVAGLVYLVVGLFFLCWISSPLWSVNY